MFLDVVSPTVPTLLAIIGYYIYYRRKVANQLPETFGGKVKDWIVQHCPSVSLPYCPPAFVHESRIMTVLASRFRLRNIRMRKERTILETPDGGEVIIEWLYDDSGKDCDTECKLHVPDVEGCKGVLLMLPGLTGNSDQNYVKGPAMKALQQGLRPVVMNYRGLGGGALKTPRTYCAANTDDVELTVNHVRSYCPDKPLIGYGVSFGGIQIVNYITSRPDTHQLDAAMTVSVPWDFHASSVELEKFVNAKLFNAHLTSNLKSSVFANEGVLKMARHKMDEIKQCKTLREFDSCFTIKQFGFDDISAYYDAGSPGPKIPIINIPLLSVQAKDDVFSPMHSLPLDFDNPNVCFVVTSNGGHIGFLESGSVFGGNYVDRVFDEYIAAIIDKRSELNEIEKKIQFMEVISDDTSSSPEDCFHTPDEECAAPLVVGEAGVSQLENNFPTA